MADHLIGHFVDQARRSGVVDRHRPQHGRHKQAARKRFTPKDPGGAALDPDQGFRQFTQRARTVVAVAHGEAQTARNDEVGPVHLVLGLLSEPEALAAKTIVAQGVTLDAVRERATAALPPAADEVPGLIPYDMDGRKVLELTFREALRLAHNYIGTEHRLLALLEFEDGAGVLSSLGVGKETTETHLRAMLGAIVAGRPPA